ncbi:MAG: formyltransferase family protein [Pyrinomonadaceae bacterium]
MKRSTLPFVCARYGWHNRGSAPINWAIIRGETTTGNTLIWLADNVDEGHIIDQIEFSYDAFDHLVTLKKLEFGIKFLVTDGGLSDVVEFVRRGYLRVDAITGNQDTHRRLVFWRDQKCRGHPAGYDEQEHKKDQQLTPQKAPPHYCSLSRPDHFVHSFSH